MSDREPIADLYICWHCDDHNVEVTVGAGPQEFHVACGYGPMQWSGQLYDRIRWTRDYQEPVTRIEQNLVEPNDKGGTDMTTGTIAPPSTDDIIEASGVQRISIRVPLDLIDDNPFQPRLTYDEKGIESLSADILRIGTLLQPPLLRPVGARFQAVFGHRRVRALRLLHSRGQWTSDEEFFVAEMSDEDMAFIALSENVQRSDLTELEVYRAYKRIIEGTSTTEAELAARIPMKRSTLANCLRVLDLPEMVLEHVESGALGISNAREFLAPFVKRVNGVVDHIHMDGIEAVVKRILRADHDRIPGRYVNKDAPPNWSRSYIRQCISEHIAYNETDWRPLGPRLKYPSQGATREASFDVKEFSADFRKCLHLVPGEEHGEFDVGFGQFQASRVWTCEVKEWSRRQTRATREANREAQANPDKAAPSGKRGGTGNDQLLERALANDPVWMKVANASPASRRSGTVLPLTGEEKEALGTRAELRTVNSLEHFYKVLKKDDSSYRYLPHLVEGIGKPVAPWLPDFEEGCLRACTAGAAYATSPKEHPLSRGTATLCCFNSDCYSQKAQTGLELFQQEIADQERRANRQDADLRQALRSVFEAMPDDAVKAVCLALFSGGLDFDTIDPTLRYDARFSWTPEVGLDAAIMLKGDFTEHPRFRMPQVEAAEAIAVLDGEDLTEVTATLTVYLLRMGGMADSFEVSADVSPENVPVEEPATRSLAEALAEVIEPASSDEHVTYNEIKSSLPAEYLMLSNNVFLPAIQQVAPNAYMKKVKRNGKVVRAAWGVRPKGEEQNV